MRHFTEGVLRAEHGLPKGKQSFVDGKDVILLSFYEEFNDDIRFAAMGEGITCASNKIFRLVYIEFQGNGKSQGRRFTGLVCWIISDFREVLAVNIGPLIHLWTGFALVVDISHEHFGKTGVEVIKDIFQSARS